MSDGQVADVAEWAKENGADGLPVLVLPSGTVTITECAANLFKLIAPTKRLFVRGGAVVSLVKRDDGLLALEILRPSAARSLFREICPAGGLAERRGQQAGAEAGDVPAGDGGCAAAKRGSGGAAAARPGAYQLPGAARSGRAN